MSQRFTLLLFWSFLICIPARAQTVYWQENFETLPSSFGSNWLNTGWGCGDIVQVGTSCFPYIGNPTRIAGISGLFIASKEVCGTGYIPKSDRLLATPPLDLTAMNAAGFCFDSYYLKQQKNGRSESARIEISTDNGTTWTLLKEARTTRPAGGMVRDYVNLSAYAGTNTVRLGFRYSDSGQKMKGWIVDNFKLFEPFASDATMEQLEPADSLQGYVQAPGSYIVHGLGRNTGSDTLKSYTISYFDANGAVQTQNVTGQHIAPMDTFSFVHNTPFLISSEGRKLLRCKVTAALDGNSSNDSMQVVLHGARFIPEKNLAIEEGTGTWNIQAPYGIVVMHQLDSANRPPSRISIHSADVMEQKDYADYIYWFKQIFTPYFLFDRRLSVSGQDVIGLFDKWKDNFGFARLDVTGMANFGHVNVDVSVSPAVDLDGKYRLALVVTQDGVHGTSHAYDQMNGYSRNRAGNMGGFETLADTIWAAQMKYDFVARSINPAPEGNAACLPVLKAGQTYTCNMSGTYLESTPFDRVNVVALLIRYADSTIVNSKTANLISLNAAQVNASGLQLIVRPNPVTDVMQVEFLLPRPTALGLMLYDAQGRLIRQIENDQLSSGKNIVEIDTRDLPAGLYFLRVQADGLNAGRMISVLR